MPIPFMIGPEIRVKVIKNNSALKLVLEKVTKQVSKQILDDVGEELPNIKDKVLSALQDYINGHRSRPQTDYTMNDNIFEGTSFSRFSSTENLFHTIEKGAEIIREGTTGWRLIIGREDDLNTHAPYWNLINYGGKSDGIKHYGYFGTGDSPRKNASRQKRQVWSETEQGSRVPGSKKQAFSMTPTATIGGMYFIEYMQNVFSTELKNLKVGKRKV